MASDSYSLGAMPPMAVSVGQQVGPKVQPDSVRQNGAAQTQTAGTQVSRPGAAVDPLSAAGVSPGSSGGTEEVDAAIFDQVAKSVDRINEMMQNGNQTLTFQLDDDSGRMVIRVMDARSKEVIRQIPSEEALQFAKYVDGLVGLIFNEKA